jgi:hypothetical protein
MVGLPPVATPISATLKAIRKNLTLYEGELAGGLPQLNSLLSAL